MVNQLGKNAWIDLTVENCRSVADFYQSVMGWHLTPVDVEDYQDFCAVLPDPIRRLLEFAINGAPINQFRLSG